MKLFRRNRLKRKTTVIMATTACLVVAGAVFMGVAVKPHKYHGTGPQAPEEANHRSGRRYEPDEQPAD